MISASSNLRAAPLPIRSVGVLYVTSNQQAAGREAEQLADDEVIEIAQAVQAALAARGIGAETINLAATSFDALETYDWIFNLTETIYGFPLSVDQVARELEARRLPFTGSGAWALCACRDKAFTKAELLRHNIPTPAYQVFAPGEPVECQLPFPLIAKPLYEDASFGITRDSLAHSLAELRACVARIHSDYQQPALVEEYIDGREITVSVLGNGEEAQVLPFTEVLYDDRLGPHFLTFDAKWLPGSSDFHATPTACPAEVDPELGAELAELSLRACRILDCSDYSRVDFRVRDRQPFVLEINPNPCINPNDAGFVSAAAAVGIPFPDLVWSILAHSWKRYSRFIALREQHADPTASPLPG